MSLKQVTVFVQNKPGALVAITDTLAEHQVNIRALSIADTQEFGILRLIVNDNDTALKTLTEEGYLLKTTDVVGVKIGDQPGKLSLFPGLGFRRGKSRLRNGRFLRGLIIHPFIHK